MSELERLVIPSGVDSFIIAETAALEKETCVQVGKYYDVLRNAGHSPQSAIALTSKYWGIDKLYIRPRQPKPHSVVTVE